MPKPDLQQPACFCEGGSYCSKHSESAPEMMQMVKLLKDQFNDLKSNRAASEDILTKMGPEIQEMFFTRQNTFHQKLIEAYVQKENEAEQYRI